MTTFTVSSGVVSSGLRLFASDTPTETIFNGGVAPGTILNGGGTIHEGLGALISAQPLAQAATSGR